MVSAVNCYRSPCQGSVFSTAGIKEKKWKGRDNRKKKIFPAIGPEAK
jgi:hypothetical protein